MRTMTSKIIMIAGVLTVVLVAGVALAHTFNHTPAISLSGPGTINNASYTLTGTVSDSETKCYQSVSVSLQSSSSATGPFTAVGSTTTDASGAYSFARSNHAKGTTIYYRTVTTGFVAGDPHSTSSHICNNATSSTVSVTRNP